MERRDASKEVTDGLSGKKIEGKKIKPFIPIFLPRFFCPLQPPQGRRNPDQIH
jgi:hypothetical protein